LEAIITGMQATLHQVPMTYEQLADAIAAHVHILKLGDLLQSGCAALLKPSLTRAAQNLYFEKL
jgi:hypothetical protein